MRVVLSERDSRDPIWKYLALIGTHHIFQVKREQPLDDEVLTASTVQLNKTRAQLCLIIGCIGDYKHTSTSLDGLNGFSNDLVRFP